MNASLKPTQTTDFHVADMSLGDLRRLDIKAAETATGAGMASR